MSVRQSSTPTRKFVFGNAAFEAVAENNEAYNATADEYQVDARVSAGEVLREAEVIVPRGVYGVIPRDARLLVVERDGARSVVIACPTDPPASVTMGETGMVDHAGEIVARVVPDAAAYFQVYDEAGTAQLLRIDATNGTVINTPVAITDDVEVTSALIADQLLRTFVDFDDTGLALPDDADILFGDATGGVATLDLPLAAAAANRLIGVVKTDASANNVQVEPTPPETIDGVSPWTITSQGECVWFFSDGVAWTCLLQRRTDVAHGASHANGGVAETFGAYVDTAATQPFAVLENHKWVNCQATPGGPQTVNLYPATADMIGRSVSFLKTDANAQNCDITAAGAETINGGAAHALALQWDCATLVVVAVGEWQIYAR